MGMSDSFLSDASVMALFLFFVRGDLHVQNDTESQRSYRVLFRGSVKVQSFFLRDSASLTDACSSSQYYHNWCSFLSVDGVQLSRPAHIVPDIRVQERSSPECSCGGLHAVPHWSVALCVDECPHRKTSSGI